MKTLLLMRHAKSSWSEAGLADIDRPLNDRGKRDAPRMGKLLQSMKLVPRLILTSPAHRARSTAQAVAEAIGGTIPVQEVDAFYGGSIHSYRKAVRILPEDLDCVLLIGHNPDMENAVDILTGEYERMPTAAIAQIQLEKWAEVDQELELVAVYRPKELT